MILTPAALRALPAGTRVVLRYRTDGGFTDALGTLTAVEAEYCLVDTRRGQVRVPLGLIVAAKQVPPPPPRR